MRKLILLMHLSLDGYVAGKSGFPDFVAFSDDLFAHVDGLIANVDTAVYGHNTYNMMFYWKTVLGNPDSSPRELHHAAWIEAVEKVVFSKTLTNPDWRNARIASDVLSEISSLKKTAGRDIMVFGSPVLAVELLNLGVVDELQLTISPVILGTGQAFLGLVNRHQTLRLESAKAFEAGAVMLHYVVKHEQ